MKLFRRVVAWGFLCGGIVGMTLVQFGVIGEGEPKLVLQLSLLALVYEGFNAVQIAEKD